MKFTDGFWSIRAGMTPHYAAQVNEFTVEKDSLTVYAPTKKLSGRGDTLNLPLLTIQYSSPMENIIHVKIIHHKGGRPQEPEFEITQQPDVQVVTSDDEKFASLTSGSLSVRIHKTGDWLVEFIGNEKTITSSGWRALGFVDTPDGRFIHEQLSLGVGECVYGLGERFTSFVKNGQVVDLWNQDGGTSLVRPAMGLTFLSGPGGDAVSIEESRLTHLRLDQSLHCSTLRLV
jgi:alpha-D-xyloside xylohydrolase